MVVAIVNTIDIRNTIRIHQHLQRTAHINRILSANSHDQTYSDCVRTLPTKKAHKYSLINRFYADK